MEELNEEKNGKNEQVNEEENKIPVTGPDSNDEFAEAQLKITELEKQLNEYKDGFLRKAADFENYKRRTENDQMNFLKYAGEHFIKNVLPVYDDLERSLNHVNDDNNLESLKKGLSLVFDKFTKVLENQGIKKIDAKGKPFDVDLHEALMQQPSDEVPPHTVLDVIEQGYIYKDKVIRHAKVIVSAETISSEKKSQNDSSEQG